jgi:hypothetical protein
LKLREKVGFKRAAVAVARKLAVVMHTMLKTGEIFERSAAGLSEPALHAGRRPELSRYQIASCFGTRRDVPAGAWVGSFRYRGLQVRKIFVQTASITLDGLTLAKTQQVLPQCIVARRRRL